MNPYEPNRIEAKWQAYWEKNKTFKVERDSSKKKFYLLEMFPYPSGRIHMGHVRNYTIGDTLARFKRMKGFNVIHPLGWDAFGMPAENAAIKNNTHPAEWTFENIRTMRKQIKALGLSYDWDRAIATSHEDYYRWTQWMFQQFFESWFDPNQQKARPISELVQSFESGQRKLANKNWSTLSEAEKSTLLNEYRIAYQKEITVNWCPGLGTVLANEEVTSERKSERGDFPVFQRPLKQWMMRITAYADRLLVDLDRAELPDGSGGHFQIDWPEPIKLMQRNWIGKSSGANVVFDVLDPQTEEVASTLTVYTTRPEIGRAHV